MSSLLKLSEKQKKQLLIVSLVVMMLTGFSLINSGIQGKESVRQGIVRGETQEEVYQETFTVKTADGEEQDIDITVYPKQLPEGQCQKLLEEAVSEFESQYLGLNPSADSVSQDLVFAESYCQGMVLAEYDSDTPELIWEDGSVATADLTEEGQVVEVKVRFTCQEHQLEYVCYV